MISFEIKDTYVHFVKVRYVDRKENGLVYVDFLMVQFPETSVEIFRKYGVWRWTTLLQYLWIIYKCSEFTDNSWLIGSSVLESLCCGCNYLLDPLSEFGIEDLSLSLEFSNGMEAPENIPYELWSNRINRKYSDKVLAKNQSDFYLNENQVPHIGTFLQDRVHDFWRSC